MVKKVVLQKLGGWAGQVQVNLKDDLLLEKDRNGQTAWHLAKNDNKNF
jgi:hypothetical protein